MVLNKIPTFDEVKDWVNNNTPSSHSDLTGVNEGDHRSDQRVADLAPVQSVNGQTGSVSTPDYTNQAGASTQSFEIGYAYDGDSQVRDGVFLPAERIDVIADGSAEPRVTLAKAGDVESGTYYQDMVMSWNLGPNYGETHKVIVHVATDYDHSHSL